MTKRWSLALCGVLLALISGVVPLGHSQGISPKVSVAIVIDNSGSNRDTDPQGIRFTAARQFIDLLDKGDEAALVLFSDQSSVLAGGLTRIEGDDSRRALKDALQGVALGGATNMLPALNDALQLLGQANPSNIHFAIFLTDGYLYLPGWDRMSQGRKAQERAAVLAKAAEFGQRNWPIYPISLSDNTDTELMKAISDATRGRHFLAATAADLPPSFQTIFAELRTEAVQILFSGPVGEIREVDYAIHPLINSITFFVTYTSDQKPRVTIWPVGNQGPISPSLTEPDYDVYRVENPQKGNWKVHLEGNGSVVVSVRLQIGVRVDWEQPTGPTRLGSPMPIRVRVETADTATAGVRPIDDASVTATIFPPGAGRTEETITLLPVGKGIYGGQYPNTSVPGSYRLELLVRRGSDVYAQVSQNNEVLPAVPETRVPERPPEVTVTVEPGKDTVLPVNFGKLLESGEPSERVRAEREIRLVFDPEAQKQGVQVAARLALEPDNPAPLATPEEVFLRQGTTGPQQGAVVLSPSAPDLLLGVSLPRELLDQVSPGVYTFRGRVIMESPTVRLQGNNLEKEAEGPPFVRFSFQVEKKAQDLVSVNLAAAVTVVLSLAVSIVFVIDAVRRIRR